MNRSRERSRKTSWKNSRPLMFGASSLWVALLLVIFVFRGGGAVPVPADEPRPEPSVTGLAQQADALAAEGNYVEAWRLYHEALLAAPEDVSLWYALGVTLSHLDERAETQKAFQYVVHRGRPDSEEVRVAGRWLVSAGVLPPPVRFAASVSPTEAPSETLAPGRVRGRTEWRGASVKGAPRGVRIVLAGEDESNRGLTLKTRATLGEPYELDKVPPGNYLLTVRMSETRLWQQRVTVEAGKETVLDLTDANTPGREPGGSSS